MAARSSIVHEIKETPMISGPMVNFNSEFLIIELDIFFFNRKICYTVAESGTRAG